MGATYAGYLRITRRNATICSKIVTAAVLDREVEILKTKIPAHRLFDSTAFAVLLRLAEIAGQYGQVASDEKCHNLYLSLCLLKYRYENCDEFAPSQRWDRNQERFLSQQSFPQQFRLFLSSAVYELLD